MTLSILIVNWKSRDYLRSCLVSIQDTCADWSPQIIVVDGGSFDGCGEMLGAEFPDVTFIQSPENVGFGRANNLGFERVTGEAVFILNPDTELKEGSVAALLEGLESNLSAGIVGPRLIGADGCLQTQCVQSLPTPLNQALDSEFLRRLLPGLSIWGTYGVFASSDAVEVEAVSGACMLMLSNVFREVGGFSPEYFMYGEDMDLCAKVRSTGRKIFHVPRAEVMHHGGGSSTGSFDAMSSVIMRESVFRFIRKHQGKHAAFLYRLLMAVSAVTRIVMLTVACLLAGLLRRQPPRRSLRKWIDILRWSFALGRRSWEHTQQHRANLDAICVASPAK